MTEKRLPGKMEASHLRKFRLLIQSGACREDVLRSDGFEIFEGTHFLPEHVVDNEVDRIYGHWDSLVPLLERFVKRPLTVLDVGCSSGAASVAMALSEKLGIEEIVGIDVNRSALEAAVVRANGYGVESSRLRFESIKPGKAFRFEDNSFDLVTCVSVLEFVRSATQREFLLNEIKRVLRSGGFAFISTPNYFRFREFHTQRWLGNWRRTEGKAWSSSPRFFRENFLGYECADLTRFEFRRMCERLGWPLLGQMPDILLPIVALASPWYKILAKKP